LTSRKRAKSPSKVARTLYAKRANDLAREWKIENLAWLVEFAFAPVIEKADCEETHRRARNFLSRSAPTPYLGSVGKADLDELHWLQTVTRNCVEKTANREPWNLSLRDLITYDPSFLFTARPPLRPYCQPGNIRALWLLTLWELLGGREARRITRCAELGCTTILVKRKNRKFCRSHGSAKERARRHRRSLKTSLPLAERRKRRHRAHQSHVKRTKGKAVAARVRKRPIRGWELARDAIETIDASKE